MGAEFFDISNVTTSTPPQREAGTWPRTMSDLPAGPSDDLVGGAVLAIRISTLRLGCAKVVGMGSDANARFSHGD